MGQSIQEWTKQMLSSTNFIWSILEYFVPYVHENGYYQSK